MRVPRPPQYAVLPTLVVMRRRGRKREFVGRDHYWSRTPQGATPFATLDDAVDAAHWEGEWELVRPETPPEVLTVDAAD